MKKTLSRRNLFKAGGAVIVSFGFGGLNARAQAPAAAGRGTAQQPDVDGFIAIHADGTVTVLTSHVDVGTGIATAYRQVTAEEIGVPVQRVKIIEGDTALTPDHGGTGGSSGIPRGAADIRRAAATARQALLEMGAKQLSRPAPELTIADGEVRPRSGGPGVALATLMGGKRFSMKVNPNAELRNPATYTVVGKALLRDDVPGKCTGSHVYLQNFRLPGMLYGRVMRPPSIGAKLSSVDESSIKSIPDVRIVRIESFLGVVAKNEWAAIRASRELKVTWSESPALPGSEGLEPFLRNAPANPELQVVSRGDNNAGFAGAAKQLTATYYWPFQSHASLGPSCSVADYKESGATVYSSTQGPFAQRTTLAKVFGIPQDKLRLVYMDGSGSYGTNGANDADADALMLSRAVGAPVRVQWSRQDELAWDPKGPAQLLDMKGAIDAKGNITAWDVHMWLPSGPGGDRALLGPDAAGMTQEHGQGAGLMTLNADTPYAAPNVRVVATNLKNTPLRLSNLRAPGKIANVFASEGFADELAAAAGMDAVAFRRRGLSDPRALAVIDRAAQMIQWKERPSPNPQATQGNLLSGRGFAYARYKQAENYVALAMEVTVDRRSGQVTVRRVTCAHDCGLIVNPDGLRNQIEGNIVQTLSRALHEETVFDRSRVTSVDWASYPILRFPEAPAIDVVMINHPEEPAYGAGEAAAAPVAAALANAIFDATQVRLHSVPFRPEQLRTKLTKV